jgi:hypothetical protein
MKLQPENLIGRETHGTPKLKWETNAVRSYEDQRWTGLD